MRHIFYEGYTAQSIGQTYHIGKFLDYAYVQAFGANFPQADILQRVVGIINFMLTGF